MILAASKIRFVELVQRYLVKIRIEIDSYLAAFTGVDAIVETGSLVTANPAEDCGTIEFWKPNQKKRKC